MLPAWRLIILHKIRRQHPLRYELRAGVPLFVLFPRMHLEVSALDPYRYTQVLRKITPGMLRGRSELGGARIRDVGSER